MKIKEPLTIWGLISGITCNWLMFSFALDQAITGKTIILDFNIFHEMWIELVLLAIGILGLLILILQKIKEEGKQ